MDSKINQQDEILQEFPDVSFQLNKSLKLFGKLCFTHQYMYFVEKSNEKVTVIPFQFIEMHSVLKDDVRKDVEDPSTIEKTPSSSNEKDDIIVTCVYCHLNPRWDGSTSEKMTDEGEETTDEVVELRLTPLDEQYIKQIYEALSMGAERNPDNDNDEFDGELICNDDEISKNLRINRHQQHHNGNGTNDMDDDLDPEFRNSEQESKKRKN